MFLIIGESPSGKATGFGPVTQRFESFLPSHSERFSQFCRLTSTSKGFLSTNSRILSLNFKFESKKLISCLFCSTLELSNNSGALEHIFRRVISVIE